MMQTATGLAAARNAGASAAATATTSCIGGGTIVTIDASTPLSSSSTPAHSACSSAPAEASISTGLPSAAAGGSLSANFSRVAAERFANSRPCSTRRSAAMTLGPPALVKIATRGPAQGLSCANPSARANVSSSVCARKIPQLAKAASTTRPLVASAPVCERAARCPRADCPTLSATMGLSRATVRAAERRRAPSSNAFQVEGDRLRMRVMGEAEQRVRLADVGLVAQADHPREAPAFDQRQVEHRGARGARMRDERDRS